MAKHVVILSKADIQNALRVLSDRQGNAIIQITADNEVWLSSGEIVDWATDWPVITREEFWKLQGDILGSIAGKAC